MEYDNRGKVSLWKSDKGGSAPTHPPTHPPPHTHTGLASIRGATVAQTFGGWGLVQRPNKISGFCLSNKYT